MTDAQALPRLAQSAVDEAHSGRPQDIEWCLVDDSFQRSSRTGRSPPCTPSPSPATGRTYVDLSVGHQQMMTDPMKPLGLSFWQMTSTAPMAEAGGRRSLTSPRRSALAGELRLLLRQSD